jgi:hypothetical protein
LQAAIILPLAKGIGSGRRVLSEFLIKVIKSDIRFQRRIPEG